jgi:hypothetical protein
MQQGDLCWVTGFGGVKVDGMASWPARIIDPTEGGPAVQAARRSADALLMMSFGDDAFVWAKPDSLRPFSGDEALLQGAPKRVKEALRIALAVRQSQSAASERAASEKAVMEKASADEKTAKEKAAKVKKAVAPAPTAPTVPVSATPAPAPAAPAAALSAYELQRLETMRQNALVLHALGVASASETLRACAKTPEKPPVDPVVRAARAAERHARMVEAQANRRSSSRLHKLPSPDAAHPKRYADESAELEIAEREAMHVRKKVRAATVGAGRGRGSRAKGALMEVMSPDERADVAAAYEEASGWLAEMEQYFSPQLSPANLRNVMKQATALATGEGVRHTVRDAFFRRGEPVRLDEDLVALRAAANQFLLPEDDPGHGWRLDHPIGKLCLFQAHLHLTKRKGA